MMSIVLAVVNKPFRLSVVMLDVIMPTVMALVDIALAHHLANMSLSSLTVLGPIPTKIRETLFRAIGFFFKQSND